MKRDYLSMRLTYVQMQDLILKDFLVKKVHNCILSQSN